MDWWVKSDLRVRWFGPLSMYVCTIVVLLDGARVVVDVSHEIEYGWRFWYGSGVRSGCLVARGDCGDYKLFENDCMGLVGGFLGWEGVDRSVY